VSPFETVARLVIIFIHATALSGDMGDFIIFIHATALSGDMGDFTSQCRIFVIIELKMTDYTEGGMSGVRSKRTLIHHIDKSDGILKTPLIFGFHGIKKLLQNTSTSNGFINTNGSILK
jgi:hypothetical protein